MESCQINFQKQLDYLLTAIDKGQVQRPTVREALAYGGLANAKMGVKKYQEAEGLYRECLRLWEDCPGDPSIYIPHLGVCLTILGRTDEAEELLVKCIKDREEKFGVKDRQSLRYVFLFLLYFLSSKFSSRRLRESHEVRVFPSKVDKC